MSKFLPEINKEALNKAKEAGNYDEIYDLLAQPLHEELYRRQTFNFMDELSDGQQVLLSYDYVRTQVGQGGFIQFIQNGYVSLLPQMVIWFNAQGLSEMATVLDDVLKVYVLNRELLDKVTTVEEFASLYNELKEFEEIDKRFEAANQPAIKLMLEYALSHLDEFAASNESN